MGDQTDETDERTAHERYAARVRGSLLGGAIGDALGAPVEFWSLADIRRAAGGGALRSYLPFDANATGTATATGAGRGDEGGRYGLITDDTQMTLFTVEGLIRSGIRCDRGIGFHVGMVHAAYDQWLDTQTLAGPLPPEPERHRSWLARQAWLYARRAPGQTCLAAIAEARAGRDHIRQYGHQAVNDSKGCGGVMRSAPFGLLPPGLVPIETTFRFAAEAAGFTHGHPTGKLASGALAVIVAGLVAGDGLDASLDRAGAVLATHEGHEETSRALAGARAAAARTGRHEGHHPPGIRDATAVEALGAGWVAEEALAIAVYAALVHPGPDEVLDALALAVTHSGDSDSTGAVCGNVLGAWHGDSALPAVLAFEVEGRGTILELADDFVYEFTRSHELHGDYGPYTRWTRRY